jgi:16S rRNA (cytosine1402-N4)-methyltransferase
MDVTYHAPVLCDEAIGALLTDPGLTYVDGTLGGGGHAERVCALLTSEGRLLCFDLDEDAIRFASQRLARFGEQVAFVRANFREMKAELRRSGIDWVGGVLLDLGVSSFQLDQGPRGFSFRSDEALDMRMDRHQHVTARDVVNGYSEEALADILFRYGEERLSRRIARRIEERRPLHTTGDLSAAVESAVGARFLVKTLARVFQALRIEVNGELDNLSAGLNAALDVLAPGGRLVVVAYHSLEDRIVKEFFRKEAAVVVPSGHKLVPDLPRVPRLRILTPHPVQPSAAEIERNPRARSARMRVAERVPAPLSGEKP